MRALLILVALLLGLPAAAQVPVAAAASLRYALDEAAARYGRETQRQVRITYAASGSLVQQIEAGAPYQLFLSADEAHVFRLAEKRLAPGKGEIYAIGRLVLLAPETSTLQVDPKLEGLREGLANGSVKKLAIANPELAPYGARAREALQHAGLWQAARPRLVIGENIGQAFQFATTGGADGGFVSLSLVKSPGFKSYGGRYALIPADWHQPLVQRMVLTSKATPEARKFHDWLLSPRGQAVLARYGYSPPPR